MGIKIIKEKRTTDYTFIHDSINLREYHEVKESRAKKDRTEPEFRLRGDNPKDNNKLKHKSKMSGGHGLLGHSPVYE